MYVSEIKSRRKQDFGVVCFKTSGYNCKNQGFTWSECYSVDAFPGGARSQVVRRGFFVSGWGFCLS